ncbi:hypothetical protein [Streptomyces sp. SID3343]|uniref:tetratricopeptide repeat protein n=1 Tax=Streptomyces sp. SID3343 TaxID=2690260 RepID=UPI00136F83D6|nr:hypothetical protein [Streptomyces sp. SID3343]MYW01889.1 hypothetical protein [Streptomyces sp. SID3343]
MSSREPNTLLAALLTEVDWSAADLARQVNAAGSAHGVRLRYDRSAVAHWLGGTRPRHPVPALVASVLSRGCGRPISPQETGLVPDARPGPLLTDRTRGPDAAERLRDLCRADVDPARHAALVRTVFAPTDPDPPLRRGPATRPTPRARAGDGRAVTSADSRTAQEMAQTFADLSARHGGRRIRTWLGLYLAHDAGHLPAAMSSPKLHSQLLVDVAQLTHLLADTTADSGHPGLARAYFEIALDLAAEAGNNRMRAITLRAMSVQAMRLGHHTHAFELADAAVRQAGPHGDAAVMAFLLGQRAHSGALVGRTRSARTDLAAAERHQDRSTAPPGAFTSYTHSALHFRSGQTFRVLGEPAHALASFEAARHRAPFDRRATALTEATLAETLADMGHLEAARPHWDVFLDLCPHLDSIEIERARARMRETLRRFPHRHRVQQRERAPSPQPHPPAPGTGHRFPPEPAADA